MHVCRLPYVSSGDQLSIHAALTEDSCKYRRDTHVITFMPSAKTIPNPAYLWSAALQVRLTIELRTEHDAVGNALAEWGLVSSVHDAATATAFCNWTMCSRSIKTRIRNRSTLPQWQSTYANHLSILSVTTLASKSSQMIGTTIAYL